MSEIVDEIYELFRTRGRSRYDGEPISQTEHALQAADLAVRAGAPDHLVVAALLHDIGHLLHGLDEEIADRGVDGRHENVGERVLADWFGPEISEPVRLHVAAKRYLCAVEPDYYDQLSDASRRSLKLQGGPMSPGEAIAFERNPSAIDAVRLRRWDDDAKIEGLQVPDLESYRDRIEAQCFKTPTVR